MEFKQRPIEYKAWNKVTKIMSGPFTLRDVALGFDYGYPASIDLPEVSEIGHDPWSDLIWLQFIDLLDKNVKKIFEGDIVKDEFGQIIVIKWNDETTGYLPFTEPGEGGYGEWENQNSGKCEVIGNIFENPELLE